MQIEFINILTSKKNFGRVRQAQSLVENLALVSSSELCWGKNSEQRIITKTNIKKKKKANANVSIKNHEHPTAVVDR